MNVRVCTCIRHERDARLVAVPDPTCPHPTVDADQDAPRTTARLRRLLRWTARFDRWMNGPMNEDLDREDP